MEKENLIWTEESRKKIMECRIFSVWEQYCKPPKTQADQETHTFNVIEAKDWCIVVPVIKTEQGNKFVMVWQWRFGANCLSLEFPGGVMEDGEKPETAAARELHEETGYKAGKITKLGEFFPNAAIQSNKIFFYLAEDLVDSGKQNLDADEYVEAELVDEKEVIKKMGKEPYIHALIGTALSLYLTRNI